jgi:hypothetical protein
VSKPRSLLKPSTRELLSTGDAHLGRAGSSLSSDTQRLSYSFLGLPVDLQYLPPDKQREPDADIRKMLIEAIMLVSRGSFYANTHTHTHTHTLSLSLSLSLALWYSHVLRQLSNFYIFPADSYRTWPAAGAGPGSLLDPSRAAQLGTRA